MHWAGWASASASADVTKESTGSAVAAARQTAKKINVRAINFALCRRCANKANKKKQIIITASASSLAREVFTMDSDVDHRFYSMHCYSYTWFVCVCVWPLRSGCRGFAHSVSLTRLGRGGSGTMGKIALGIVLTQAAVPTLHTTERDREKESEWAKHCDLYGRYTWPHP